MNARTWFLTVACLWLTPVIAQAQTTALFIDSQPDDFIGAGQRKTLTPADATFAIQLDFDNRVRVTLNSPASSWALYFRAADKEPLAPGSYSTARGGPYPAGNELTVNGEARGCNELSGRFTIREAVYSGMQVVRFAADFEQHCGDRTPALFGAIRYNSIVSTLVPFDGKYPSVKLSISPMPSHGQIAGRGVDCGGTHLTCEVSPEIGSLSLNAIPDPGYVFGGWTQDCSGGSMVASVNVNSEKICSALFLPLAPETARSMAVFVGSPGDWLTQGKTNYFSQDNSTWMFYAGLNYQLQIRFNGPAFETVWFVQFAPPTGQTFVPGQQYAIDSVPGPGVAGLSISGDSHGCGHTSGTMLVREWVPGAEAEPERFAIDFQLRCDTSPPMAGVILYRSPASLPVLRADRDSLAVGIVRNGTAIVSSTSDQQIQIAQIGLGTVTWEARSDQPWLTAVPATGSGSGTVTVKVQKTASLPPVNRAVGHIYIVARGAINVPEPVTVTANLVEQSLTGAPFGAIDSPVDGVAGVAGSIGVTGWALDDIGIAGLRLYRAPVAGEGGAQIFIGNPVRVEGARPDVAAANPLLPMNSTAGWGYMLLTNMLPNGGNGRFTFYVYADDVDGHTTLLGSRSIVTANMGSPAPFGAIDTPGQGEVVSGTVNNFGWVLAPGFIRADPPAGGVVQVFIDGVAVGSPTGWTSRFDLSALFPVSQYSGIGTALGVFTFDTTVLTDGTHTIAWGVTDSTGGSAGVGSRYFTVFNGGASSSSGVTARASAASTVVRPTPSADPIQGRIGFDAFAPYVDLYPDQAGTIVVQSHELERVELRLSARDGHLLAPGGPEPLPMGVALDADGTFTWQPGVAYVGAYRFLFDTPAGPRRVDIVLNPRR